MYDQFGTADPSQGFGGAGGPFGGGSYTYTTSGFDGFSDIFGDLGDLFGFGSGRGSSRQTNGPAKGADLRYSIDLTFEEAYTGVSKEINITRNENVLLVLELVQKLVQNQKLALFVEAKVQ